MKIKPKTMMQYCIDAQYVDEVLSAIPRSIVVESLAFRAGQRPSTKKCSRSNRLTQLGVTNLRKSEPTMDASGRLSGVSRATIKKNIKEICSTLGLSYDSVVVTRLTLSFNGVMTYFTRVTKEIRPDETDQRKKLIVLGQTSADGNIAPTIKELSAKKYSCTFERVFTTHVICSELNRG